ncbi:glycine receptor subunit alpha-2-like isoform X2 [Brevipalpus obovatus]
MKHFLPDNYDSLQPPRENGKPTVVRFHVWVLSLDSIDEGSMSYVTDVFMSQTWKDHRLELRELTNTSEEYRLLPLKWLDHIWRPDSYFKNAKQVRFQTMTVPNHYIWLYPDKRILYMVKLTLMLSCAMKFQSYPHDTQTCTLSIESLSYTMKDLIFDWEHENPFVVEEDIELPQHRLMSYSTNHCHHQYSSGNFTCIQGVFKLKRRLGYYIFHTYIPTCLIVIMSWISFWIKPEAVPARVTLCVTSLLTLSTQHAQSQKSLPPVSYIKAIDIFMSCCTLFVFSSLMEYALVNILMTADEKYNNLHGSLSRSLNTTCSPDSLPSSIKIRTNSRRNGSMHSAVFVKRLSRAILVDKVSRWAFPSTFILLNILYWYVYVDWGMVNEET